MKTIRALAVAGAAFLLLSACAAGSSDPDQILKQSYASMAKLTSYGFAMKSSADGMSAEMSGAYKAPETVYVSMTLMGQNIKMYLQDFHHGYMSSGGEWVAMPAEQLAQIMSQADISQNFKLAGMARQAKLVGSESVGGVDCHKVSFSVDPAEYSKVANGELMKSATVSGIAVVALIGKSDSYIHQMDLTMQVQAQGKNMQVAVQFSLSDIGKEPVFPTIPAN